MAPRSVEALDLSNTTASYFAPATTTAPGARLMHISGQVGNTKGGHTPADYESQINLALLNIRKLLIAAGAKVTDIAKLTVFIVNYDPANRKHPRPIQRFLRGHRPAMSLVPVPRLAFPEWLIEIEAVVVVPPAAAPKSVPRSLSVAPQSSVDVVIVGAGLAGLAAAQKIVQSGLTCVVLEARDRVGGKTWSQPSPMGNGVCEVGAGWINDVNQARMYALARQFGLELLEQNTTGKVAFEALDGAISDFQYGELPEFNSQTAADVARIRDLVEAHCHGVSVLEPKDTKLDAMSFEAYIKSLGASEEALLTATVWTRAMLGVEPRDMSALFFLNYCVSGGGLLQMRSDRKGGGQHLRVRQGTQSFSTGLASLLPEDSIRLNTAVKEISQNGHQSIAVTAADGSLYHARKAITTVPSPALKTINFSPKLHPLKEAWSEAAGYGYYTKALMIFKTPFWVQKGFCGLAQSFTGPASVIRDTCSEGDNLFMLTCFMSGPPGQEWAALPKEGRVEKLLEQLGKLFKAEGTIKGDFFDMVAYEWANDEWAGYGCPCAHLPPGVLDTLGPTSFRDPLGNLHFAGTETSGEWKGYMEGAVLSGERAADEIINDLSSRTEARL